VARRTCGGRGVLARRARPVIASLDHADTAKGRHRDERLRRVLRGRLPARTAATNRNAAPLEELDTSPAALVVRSPAHHHAGAERTARPADAHCACRRNGRVQRLGGRSRLTRRRGGVRPTSVTVPPWTLDNSSRFAKITTRQPPAGISERSDAIARGSLMRFAARLCGGYTSTGGRSRLPTFLLQPCSSPVAAASSGPASTSCQSPRSSPEVCCFCSLRSPAHSSTTDQRQVPLTHTTESRQPQLARGGSVGPHTRRLDAVRSGLGGGAERHSVAWVWRAIRCRDREKDQPRSTTAATVSAGSSGMRLPPNRRAGGQLSPLPKLWTIGTSAPDRLHVTRHDVGHAATT
jgi:hypothetical protein